MGVVCQFAEEGEKIKQVKDLRVIKLRNGEKEVVSSGREDGKYQEGVKSRVKI